MAQVVVPLGIAAGVTFLVLLGCSGRVQRALRPVFSDLRAIAGEGGRGLRILLASLLSAIAHVAVFIVALWAVAPAASLSEALPLAVVVISASAIPLNIAGWGPREGTAAWAFSTTGLGASHGVTVSVIYGVLVLFATLPGAAAVLWSRQITRHPGRSGELIGSVGIQTVEGMR